MRSRVGGSASASFGCIPTPNAFDGTLHWAGEIGFATKEVARVSPMLAIIGQIKDAVSPEGAGDFMRGQCLVLMGAINLYAFEEIVEWT